MRIIDGFTLRDIMGQSTVIGEGVEQVDFSKLVTLNSSAAYLWKSVQGQDFTTEELALLLVKRYGIEYPTALADATTLSDEWIRIGLIEL